MGLEHYTLTEAREGLIEKSFSASELVDDIFGRIKKYNAKLNAYVSVNEKESRNKAEYYDSVEADYTKKPLAGIPIAVKDNMLIRGGVTSAGSKMLERYTSAFTATAVARLEEAGAIIIGKTNLDEFAMGSSTENSAFGPTHNPWDTAKVPGGSSGGSAVAVAADLATAAIGSDTGGSIRQPASFCGCVGFKPTYGMVSRYGLIAMASSLDQIGPLAKSVEDAVCITSVIAGNDKHDASTTRKHNQDITWLADTFDVKGMRIGLPKEFFAAGLDATIAETVKQHALALEQLGARIEEVSLPLSKYSLPVYYIIMPSEVSANLGRYDGIRYGLSDRSGKTLDSVYFNSRTKGFGDEVRRRIIIGTYALSSGYYDAFYGRAQKVRNRIKEEFDSIFSNVDALITPTSPSTAFGIGERTDDPVTMYLSDIFTVSANVAGIPALSIPAGCSDGMPFGLQIMGRQYDDARVLGIGRIVEEQIRFERLCYSL